MLKALAFPFGSKREQEIMLKTPISSAKSKKMISHAKFSINENSNFDNVRQPPEIQSKRNIYGSMAKLVLLLFPLPPHFLDSFIPPPPPSTPGLRMGNN